ncbi:hypothetical protein TWF481_002610 [Arthrobotrys musiformis]|uniref:Uncharacterized protein n=1 Tax=Arthrobotrys musiformis TaxID=47236 RepID=A0AAV9VTL8_9PEZI
MKETDKVDYPHLRGLLATHRNPKGESNKSNKVCMEDDDCSIDKTNGEYIDDADGMSKDDTDIVNETAKQELKAELNEGVEEESEKEVRAESKIRIKSCFDWGFC